MMDENARIFVAGHQGMVGSALVRALEARGFSNLLLQSREELDLRRQGQAEKFFHATLPNVVILAAAHVGGIGANVDAPGEFLYDNLAIQNNVIHHSCCFGVDKFCFLGSSCAYPRVCPQPMRENFLFTGPLEPTNEGYGIAKLVGVKMVEFYRKQYGFNGISVIPCNLYGTNDNFDPEYSHVLAALVRKFVEAAEYGANEVTLWGTGEAKRELMHVDDAAEAILFAMEHHRPSNKTVLNAGWGKDISVKDLAELIAEKAGFEGEIKWDNSKPDGMPKKCLDVSRMTELGFEPTITLEQGIEQTIQEFKDATTQRLS
jgi:GDP-L-fucose synthase